MSDQETRQGLSEALAGFIASREVLDTNGKPLPEDRALAVLAARDLVEGLSDEERGIIFRSYCRDCYRFVGNGCCHCENNE